MTKQHSKGHICKCPNCKDKKRRMYILWNETKGIYNCYCHNCGYSKILINFLEDFYTATYDEYKRNRHVKHSSLLIHNPIKKKKRKVRAKVIDIFKTRKEQPYGCTPADQLKEGHKVKEYLINREIPEKYWNLFYFAKDFKQVANHYGYKTDKWISESRLIIPFWDMDKNLIFVQGRSFDKNPKIKYITLELQKGNLKLWGLSDINIDKTIYITEGPIDAMFLNNSLAIAGSKISNKELMSLFPKKNCRDIVFVFDNEPHNKDVVASMLDKIKFGFSVVIWNRQKIKEKDINDMIMFNEIINIDNIMLKLHELTFYGVRAKNKVKFWR